MRTQVKTHQCRCWMQRDGQCTNGVGADTPYCDLCEDRHNEAPGVAYHVDFDGTVVPG